VNAAHALLRAAHPGPSFAVTAMAAMLAVRAGLTGARMALVVAAVLAGQLSVGWLNDWWDAGRDTSAGRDDKPVVAGQISRTAVGRAALAAALTCGALSVALGVAGAVNLFTVASAWVYDLWAKATRASVVPYIVSFGLLPAVVTLAGRPSAWPPGWMITAGALLGAGGHFANALPDLESDRRLGVLGLPQRLGPRVSLWVAAATLGAGAIVAASAQRSAVATAATITVTMTLLGGVVVAGLRGHHLTAFWCTMALAVVAVAALLLPTP
jgi:4-hydroxybenzoate polyprenyltransferase